MSSLSLVKKQVEYNRSNVNDVNENSITEHVVLHTAESDELGPYHQHQAERFSVTGHIVRSAKCDSKAEQSCDVELSMCVCVGVGTRLGQVNNALLSL